MSVDRPRINHYDFHVHQKKAVLGIIASDRLEECAAAFRNPLHNASNITSIAFANGFSSLPHFSRVFRQHYGATPGEFRRSNLI